MNLQRIKKLISVATISILVSLPVLFAGATNKALATDLVPPGVPTGLEATPHGTSVVLNWTAPEDTGGSAISTYDVEYKLHSAETWTPSTDEQDGASVRVTGLTVDQEYDFKVAATNDTGTGDFTELVSATTALSANDFDMSSNLGNETVGRLIASIEMSMDVESDWNSFTITDGSLPDGITIDPETGTLSGTPTTIGTSTFTIHAESSDYYADQEFTLHILAAPDYDISTCQQLQNIASDTGGSFTLHQDIDCSDTVNWNDGAGFMPIYAFTGTLDGQNHTINNLYENVADDNAGLFSYITGATISNLTISSDGTATISGSGNTGALVGDLYDSTINNVTINEVVHGTSSSYVAGLVAFASCSDDSGVVSLTNIKDTANVLYSQSAAGNIKAGLIGYIDVNNASCSVTVNHASSTGDVSPDAEGFAGYSVGGLIGGIDAYSGSTVLVENSSATGNITAASAYVGGLIGYLYASDDSSNIQVRDTFASGNVTADPGDDGYVGGLIGYTQGTTQVSQSLASGAVRGDEDLGGLIGYVSGDNTTVNIDQSEASGAVGNEADNNNYVGGLIGETEDAVIHNSYSTSVVTGQEDVGGLIGSLGSTALVATYASGTVAASDKVGGLVGDARDGSVDDSFAAAAVSGDTNVHGMFGSFGEVEFSNNFLDAQKSGSDCDQCTLVNTVESPDATYFFNNHSSAPMNNTDSWNFGTVWQTVANNYPTFQYLADFPAFPQPAISVQRTNSSLTPTWEYPVIPGDGAVLSSEFLQPAFGDEFYRSIHPQQLLPSRLVPPPHFVSSFLNLNRIFCM